MGNGCMCLQNINYQDVQLDTLLEKHMKNINDNEQLEVTNLYTIAKYFNEGEREINTKIESKNIKRMISHKKAKERKSYNIKGDSKYELMLKRLLEQKKIERKGPKRRSTIRTYNNEEITKLIEDVVKENEKKSRSIGLEKAKRESILLNNKEKKELNHSRQSFITKKFEHKKIKNNIEETEINCGNLFNDIKNINITTNSNYISDANYTCLLRDNSQIK